MLIVAALAAVTLAARPTLMPPMIVQVSAAPNVPPALVDALLAETEAVWRGTGISFLWRADAHEAAPPRRTPDLYDLPLLRLIIGNDTHPVQEHQLALGWIVFDGGTTPEREIYLSYANARQLLASSSRVTGPVAQMPPLEQTTLLARAMGRALAHELGHYLLSSKVHSEGGLMKAVHTAATLFAPDRGRFKIPPAEQQRMVARFTSIYMASRG